MLADIQVDFTTGDIGLADFSLSTYTLIEKDINNPVWIPVACTLSPGTTYPYQFTNVSAPVYPFTWSDFVVGGAMESTWDDLTPTGSNSSIWNDFLGDGGVMSPSVTFPSGEAYQLTFDCSNTTGDAAHCIVYENSIEVCNFTFDPTTTVIEKTGVGTVYFKEIDVGVYTVYYISGQTTASTVLNFYISPYNIATHTIGGDINIGDVYLVNFADTLNQFQSLTDVYDKAALQQVLLFRLLTPIESFIFDQTIGSELFRLKKNIVGIEEKLARVVDAAWATEISSGTIKEFFIEYVRFDYAKDHIYFTISVKLKDADSITISNYI